jgi:hypothetical protein
MFTKANIPNTDVLFREIQRFRQLWLQILLIAVMSFAIYNLAQEIIHAVLANNNPPDIEIIIVSSLFGIGLPILFYLLNLTIEVRPDGICIRFFPFHLSFRVIRYADIESYKETNYHAIKEYGGWGIKYGRKGKAYTVFGNRGVQLKLKNGDEILIGSQKPEELTTAIDQAVTQGK